MKQFVLALSLTLLAGFAQAETPVVHASKVTCAELQAQLVNYGTLNVVKKIILGIKKTVYVHADAGCDSNDNAYTVRTSFKTKDKKSCKVGEYCKYYSSSSYSSGYSSGSDYSSGSSGSSYDYGSSGSSGSSSGSSYNPPSSSYEGSSYNPPSSGNHGSHYCPTCSL